MLIETQQPHHGPILLAAVGIASHKPRMSILGIHGTVATTVGGHIGVHGDGTAPTKNCQSRNRNQQAGDAPSVGRGD